MSESEEQRRSAILRAWTRWLVIFVPLMALIGLVSAWLDFNLILAALIVLLVGTLLYQRHVNSRSWNSILWGVYASKE